MTVPNLPWIRRVIGCIADRYDHVIIHSHSYQFPQTALWQITLGRSKRRWWATIHTTNRPRPGLHNILRPLLQRLRMFFPDRVYGCSQTSARMLSTMFRPESVGVLVNGRLDATSLEAFPARDGVKSVLFVGRLIKAKGVWPLLEAGEQLARARRDFSLTIVGGGREETAMREWIRTRGLESQLRMTGYQSDVAQYFAQADLLIAPTQPPAQEGLPLVALEAKGFALPVLYSASGGMPETQIEGETGLLLNPPDAANIVAGVTRLMDDSALYHRMREAIRVERRRWSSATMVKAYVAEYRREFGILD